MQFEDWVAKIRANPDDDSLRLICADWLEEQGDPRGEFIRLQCQAASQVFANKELRERIRQLLQKNRDQWIAPAKKLAIEVGFECGFLEYANYATGSVERTAEQIAKVANIEVVRHLRDSSQLLDISSLNEALPHLAHLKSLEVWQCCCAGDEDMRPLLTTPHLINLKRLVVQFERGRSPSTELLVEGLCGKQWKNLKELCVNIQPWPDDTRLENELLQRLAVDAAFQLQRIDLQGVFLDDKTATALVQSPLLQEVAAIDLSRAIFTDTVLEILLKELTRPSLRWLCLYQAEFANAEREIVSMLEESAEWVQKINDRFGDIVDWETEYVTPWSPPKNAASRFWPDQKSRAVKVTETGFAGCRLL